MPLIPPPKPAIKPNFTMSKPPASTKEKEPKGDVIPMAHDGLPEAPTDQEVKLNSLKWMFVAPPGFGKTDFFSLFPDCLMLACEEGHKFIKGFKILIDTWAPVKGVDVSEDSDGNMHMSFLESVKRITSSDRFQFIFIDTLDALSKKCIDHYVLSANQAHLSDLGDYGKGYDLGQNDPIRRAVGELLSSGRGIGVTTHQQIETRSFNKGTKSKKETSLPNGIYKLMFPQMDVIIHGEFGGIREGNTHRDRIIKSEGSEDILAKNRGGVLPPAWIAPLDREERIEQLKSFFDGTEQERAIAIKKAHDFYLSFYED